MELFVVCIEGVGQSRFERALAQEILGRDALDPKQALVYRVDYPDGSGGEVSCDEGDDLDSIAFDHFGGRTFFDRVWELADRIGALIFWPAPGPSNALTRAELLDRLPSELRDEERMPIIVRSGRELYDAVEESFPPIDAGEEGAEE
jgi:hypothetical protein